MHTVWRNKGLISTDFFSKLGIKIKEVPITYKGRTYEEGKKIVAMDGLKAIWTLFKYRYL